MTCRELQSHLSDYLDGVLPLDQQKALREHAKTCRDCREEVDDMSFALGVMREAPPVEPPEMLVQDILRDTIGQGGYIPAAAGAPAGLWGMLGELLHPFVEPRFAMSMAMAVLSFSMLTYSGQKVWLSWQNHQAGPVAAAQKIGQKLGQAWDQGIEVYETLRLSYAIETALDEPEGPPAGSSEPTTPNREGVGPGVPDE